MKRLFRKLHLWLSVPLGLLITAICFSGAALVFENEIMRLIRHDVYYVERVTETPLAADSIVRRVAQTLPQDVKVTGITFFNDPQRTCQVNLSKPHRAAIFVDRYTGEMKGDNQRTAFFAFMFRLHRWLLDSDGRNSTVWVGKLIVGITTALFVVIVITGVVLWWPRNRKALLRGLKISVTKGWRRFWYDFHVVCGVYASLLLLVMALTGLTWSFGWYRTGVYTLFGAETAQTEKKAESQVASTSHGQQVKNRPQGDNPKGQRQGRGKTEDTPPFLHWQAVYEELVERNPHYKQITVSDGSASVSFHQAGNQRASDRYAFDTRTGAVGEVTLYADAERSGKIRGWIYSLHVGSWGGMVTRILSFLAALLGATFPLTGYYLWIRRWWNKRRNQGSVRHFVA